MLGPALSQLLVILDKRKDKLTPFEEALHRELVGILLTQQFQKKMLGAASGTADTPATEVELPKDYLGTIGLAGNIHDLLGDTTLKVQVGTSGGGKWGSSPQMQVACPRPDCPNKVL